MDFAQNLESRCTTTKSEIDRMMMGLNNTSLRLENTTNKMLSLKNLQFMEARVHDETESSVNTANKNAALVSISETGNSVCYMKSIKYVHISNKCSNIML